MFEQNPRFGKNFDYSIEEDQKFLNVCVWSSSSGGVGGMALDASGAAAESAAPPAPESLRAKYTNGAARR